jgi:2-oxoglutarate ferredoxin oxidoreductase subunit alpha
MQGEDNPDLLLLSWGSSRGPVQEAATHIRSEGKKVATLHFSQVWPLVPEQFMGYLENAQEVVCVEGNALGQFARLIRRETGFQVKKKILRYDGLPLTPEWILRGLDANKS